MSTGGLECSSVYTAACPNAARSVCSANPILNFDYKMNITKIRVEEKNNRPRNFINANLKQTYQILWFTISGCNKKCLDMILFPVLTILPRFLIILVGIQKR